MQDATSKCRTKKSGYEDCLQCRENFYLNINECVDICPANTEADEKNKICRIKTCPQKNCEKCRDNQCRKCYPGSYLYEGQCLDRCPIGFRADRKSWSCKVKEGNFMKVINLINFYKIYHFSLSFRVVIAVLIDVELILMWIAHVTSLVCKEGTAAKIL